MRWFFAVLVVVIAACGGKRAAVSDELEARCTGFADRVAKCAFHESVKPRLTEDERVRVTRIAHDVCTKETDDADALHYYGNVDRKIACMANKDCDGVRACLTAAD